MILSLCGLAAGMGAAVFTFAPRSVPPESARAAPPPSGAPFVRPAATPLAVAYELPDRPSRLVTGPPLPEPASTPQADAPPPIVVPVSDQPENRTAPPDMAAVEEDEDKIPVDAAHKGFTPLSFRTLASYKYEVFVPDEDAPGGDLPLTASRDQIPDRIKALNGKRVAIRGFMVPTVVETDGVKGFLLTRSRDLCCFGIMPKMNEWIDATLDGKSVPFYSDVVITVYGTLEVGEERDGDVVLSLYRLRVEDVVPLRDADLESYYM